jgi:hypothetical protein
MNKVELGFPPKSSWDNIDKTVGEFTKAAEAVVAVMHAADIICSRWGVTCL